MLYLVGTCDASRGTRRAKKSRTQLERHALGSRDMPEESMARDLVAEEIASMELMAGRI